MLELPAKYFTWLVTEDIVADIKPALEPFEKAITLSGASAEECLYVGNSPSKDMRPAKQVGMSTVLIARDPTPEDLENADTDLPDVKMIINILPQVVA